MIELTVLMSAALAGFLGSGHCVVMCGAISESLNRACGARCGGSSLRNISRVAGYGLMGAMVGGLGAGALSSARALALRDYAQLLSGLMLVLIGATLLVDRQAFAKLEAPARKLIPVLLKLRSKLPNKSGVVRDIAGGLLWSCMPCGMVYAALLSAWFSVSAVQGGLIMLSFGLGTMPAMLGLSAVLALLKRKPQFAKLMAVSLLSLGIVSLGFASGLLQQAMGSHFGGYCLPSF
jgi:uncharacterized protein